MDIFQIDSDVVRSAYQGEQNFLIAFDERYAAEGLCAVYFSSNLIYYPNNEKFFSENILRKNRYEWYGLRIPRVHKHIYLRDIKKQWYLTGINSILDAPWKLADWLASETQGYSVITVGSSAGGYAAVLYGQLLGAVRTYCFNPQFEINSLLQTSNAETDPILFRNAANPGLRRYYDLRPFITQPGNIFYFHSNGSQWDIEQLAHIRDLGVNVVSFRTKTHGTPVLKSTLAPLLALPEDRLRKLAGKTTNPFLFSYQLEGPLKTIASIYQQVAAKVKHEFKQLRG